ncbi:hypothetical protein ElyMa_005503200 [Elysia marginata]|uniref:Uncharacterized protein n=1 Tax=Elysia marginata TaxID=1093978 RepID=A0AAV4ETK7_9GAST|nr:hypothetical protein ElyMa_005503200 [Elysia marginata]
MTLLSSLVNHYHDQQQTLYSHLINILINFSKNKNTVRTNLFLCALYKQAETTWCSIARNKIRKLRNMKMITYRTTPTYSRMVHQPVQTITASSRLSVSLHPVRVHPETAAPILPSEPE